MEPYSLNLMFEWGGGCLWCNDDVTKERYGSGPIESVLPLSNKIKSELEELTEWHNHALDWNDPAGPSPWSDDEFEKFDKQALELLQTIQNELGKSYIIKYIPLGGE